MAIEVTKKDIYSSAWPNAKQAYQGLAIHFAKMALEEAMGESKAYPNTMKMQSSPFEVTYTVTITVSNMAQMPSHQDIVVTAVERNDDAGRYFCAVCHEHFDDDPHTMPDGEDCHAACCPECNGLEDSE